MQMSLKQLWNNSKTNQSCFSVLFQFYFSCKSRFTDIPQSNSFCHMGATDAMSTAGLLHAAAATRIVLRQHVMKWFCSIQYGFFFSSANVDESGLWSAGVKMSVFWNVMAMTEKRVFCPSAICTYADRQLIEIRPTINIAYSKQWQSE